MSTAMSPPIHQSSDSSTVSSICKTYSLTTAQFSTLHTRAVAAKATAYCPYSRFRVGATVLTTKGEFVDGANVENAAYPVGTCAERVAFGKAVTMGGFVAGGKKGKEGKGEGDGEGWGFKAVAVATDISPPASPCGMCRQFIREFCDLDTPIFMFDKDDAFIVMKLEQLLPLSFGPEALPPPGSIAHNG